MVPDPEEIANWQRLDPRTTTSGKLRDEDIPKLAETGIRHVINLALDSHPDALADEGQKLAAHDVAYTHIPVPFDAPAEDHYAAFRDAIEHGPQPVHVHCIMNWRVSAFFYRYNRECRGMTPAEAKALMERQWSPEASEHPAAPAWRRFIAKPDD